MPCLIGVGGEAVASPPIADARPAVTLTADGLILDWRAPPAQLAPQADGAVRVELAGYAQTDRPGEPQLPFASALIALPPDAIPTVEVLLSEASEQLLPGPLAIAPRPEGVVRDSAGEVIGGAFAPATEAHPIRHDPIEIDILGSVRGVRLARVTFYPVTLIDEFGFPQSSRLRLVTHLRAAIHFNAPVTPIDPSSGDNPLLAAVRSAVVNPAQLQPTIQPANQPTHSPPSAFSNPTAAIEVNAAGITAITYQSLISNNFPLNGVNPHHLHLTRAGIEIAAEWDGDADAIFESGERLLFYATPRFSRYATHDVYFLSLEATPGLRMSSRSAAPAGYPAGSVWISASAEANALYTPDCLCPPIPAGRDGDRWTWDVIRRPDRASVAYPIQLPTVNAAQPAALTLWLIGYTNVSANPDHRVDAALNGRPLGRIEWDGKQAITATLPITPGILNSGLNTISLTLPGLSGITVEGMWLDAFAIRYARGSAAQGNAVIFTGDSVARTYTLALSAVSELRAYDITDADHPIRLTQLSATGNAVSLSDPAGGGAHVYALASGVGVLTPAKVRLASTLAAGDNFSGADYVIISHADFISALSDLVALRQSQGLSVVVENAQAIYDAYGEGRPDPNAIRAYLAHAYATWPEPPTYALLVGDGTSDPKRYRPDTPPTLIPPYLAEVDPWMGETAADNRFVTIDGDDSLPDVLLGRLPVNTPAQAQIVVDKIVKYETRPWLGTWNGNAVFIADNNDPAGNFPAESDFLITNYITTPFTAQRVYFTPPTPTLTTTRQTILNWWNAGAGLIAFTGHSSIHQWATERFFHLEDVPGVNNGGQLPVVLGLTCFTGSFHNPSFDTLDEALLRKSNGGAIAAWGATGLGVSTGHTQLAEGFLNSLYRDRQPILGSAALSGKLRLAATSSHSDLLDTFGLLGDPATRMNLTIAPWPHSIYLPSIRR